MIALGYGITYIWGTVGIILICKYLPKWWGVDAKKAAKEYEEKFGYRTLTMSAERLPASRARAYRLENKQTVGRASPSSARLFPVPHPQHRAGGRPRASPDLVMQMATS